MNTDDQEWHEIVSYCHKMCPGDGPHEAGCYDLREKLLGKESSTLFAARQAVFNEAREKEIWKKNAFRAQELMRDAQEEVRKLRERFDGVDPLLDNH